MSDDLITNVLNSNTASASTRFIQRTSNNANTSGIQSMSELVDNTHHTEEECSVAAADDDDDGNAMTSDDIQPATTTDTSDASGEEVVLSVIWKKGVLGAAYYSVETSEVYVFLDIVDVQPEFNMLKSLFYQVHPTKVVTSGSLAERFISTVKLLVNYEDSDEESSSGANNMLPQRRLHFMPGKECKFDLCKRRVLALRLPSEPEDSSEDEHTLYMNMLINFRAESMVLAFGTLLKYLDKAWVTLSLQNTWTSAPVLVINTVSLADIVTVDAETYEALQIFSQRMHPSSFKMWTPGSSREGLSIYGLFNRCKSQLGGKFMKVMLLHPTKDIDILNDRLDLISFCLQPRYEEAVKNMTDCLKHLKSITSIVTKLTTARTTVKDWKTLNNSIYHSILLHELCSTYGEEAALFGKIASCEISDLYKLTYCITRVVDFPESEKQKKVVIQLGLDEELDRKKQTHGGLSLLLNQVADLELKDLPLYIQACSMIYIPEIGFLVALPFWKDCMQNEDFQIQSLELMFIAGDVAHYKTKRCRELDSTLGDILLQISEQESRIILKLVDFVQEKLLPLHEILKLGAELDCLIALAAVAKENGYCRPTLTHERVLDIVDGRHPLQEMCVDSFVPNDTRSSSEHGLMKLLTGPNASGKSIYLKQVALISYLAHVGSFVSATSATIGILDHIHTRIQTVESIATQLSAFMIDLKQMALSLYCSTPFSLIIIDEFGKGTSEVDGLALLVSCLRHYLSREENCPHVFVSTHFHQVCEMLPRTKYLMFQNLEYMLDRDDQIVYLFKLKEGSVMSSFALIVAESLGAGSAAKRAQEVLVAMRVGEGIKRNPDCKMTLKQAQYINLARKFLSSDINENFSKQLYKDLKSLD